MDGATAAISLITFSFQAFQGCVQAFEFFYTANHIGPDGDLLRTFLEFEKYRLITWAQRVGIESSRFKSRDNLNWQMARMHLEQLRAFLTTTDQLKERYSLDITAESIEKTDPEVPNRGIAKLINKLSPSIYTTAGKVIQASNGPIKRLRWATRDKDKLKRFIGEIRTIIDNLDRLLDQAERESAVLEYNRLIRGIISLSPTTADVGQIIELVDDGSSSSRNKQAIRAAASFKQIRLAIGADKRDDEVKPTSYTQIRTEMPKLKKLKRALKPWDGEEDLKWMGLEFANYHGRQVLIQWKSAEGPAWAKYEDQMKCLTVLLMSITDESFSSLTCFGYYPMKDRGAHGIVYEMPNESVNWGIKSLKEIMTTCRLISLARRLEIARTLAETVLQLHTAGWMHKNLRSDNVVFLASHDSDAKTFIKSKPYIVGYDYARPDTDEAAQKYTQLLDDDLETELYRHPQARGAKREVYQKRFDMYALACVLIELVTWKPLAEIFSICTKTNLKDELVKAIERSEAADIPSLTDLFESKEAADYLGYHVGPTVVEIIKTCASIERSREGEEGMLQEQAAVVEKLSWCRI